MNEISKDIEHEQLKEDGEKCKQSSEIVQRQIVEQLSNTELVKLAEDIYINDMDTQGLRMIVDREIMKRANQLDSTGFYDSLNDPRD